MSSVVRFRHKDRLFRPVRQNELRQLQADIEAAERTIDEREDDARRAAEEIRHRLERDSERAR